MNFEDMSRKRCYRHWVGHFCFFLRQFLLFRWLKRNSNESHKAGADLLLKTLHCASVTAGLLANLKMWSLRA